MSELGWRVRYVPAELTLPARPLPFVNELPTAWSDWLADEDVPSGTPYLISPTFEYDVDLNAYFLSHQMLGAAKNTRNGYARDVKAFLDFLWVSRRRTSWRDATEADHIAYLVWRRRDPNGPRIDDATWDRELAGVNSFYRWQLRAGNVAANPIPQRPVRQPPIESGRRRAAGGETPATASHGAAREKIEWLPADSYRRWRDVGMRGYTPAGLPDPAFRGRFAARNSTFCDLMVRTGMRLSEQSALTLFELPLARGLGGYQRFWLPPVIAKGGSARWIYVPESVVADLIAYGEIDRAEVIADARAAGRYRRARRPFVVEDPTRSRPQARQPGGAPIKVRQLDLGERRNLYIDGPDGLEPAAFWLSEYGLPMAVSSWKGLFGEANKRCARHALALRAHAHMLRHTFAVITLEQMQRGHIANLAKLEPAQREHYTRVFGDPPDWVRRRLGHRSVTTTHIYFHCLAELEMETRLALVPDAWEDPRDTALSRIAV
ncbi:Site-specific recombinase XerD [Prauserella marina]|uniref:Site-specific recombinase XerD n=1 Tax=Prauserella marina TaxID=530584 RepID=A0A1G6Z3N6_9PSEU|nr:site-specific integrase [Prauserella marina]PWV71307.1 site-specific recombinase XerD [Prauserella marina]SDD96883.1 Site-specific recombinase XerD [Prauserella marina]